MSRAPAHLGARVAASAADVPYSRIRELAEEAMVLDGQSSRPEDRVLRLYFGESNLPTPEFIKRAAEKALRDGLTYYTENAGTPGLRRTLCRYYESTHGVALEPGEIVVTASGVQALNVAIRCLLDPGDEAIILTPAWPNGSAIVQLANALPRQIAQPLSGSRYSIDFDRLEAAVTPRTRFLLYTSPSNPLGWVATEADQERLLEFTRRHGLWLLADEVYERLWYQAEPGAAVPSILRKCSREDAVIVAQSFSKTYCMTGWRLGWLVARGDLAARAAQLNEFIVSHAATFTQRAAEEALLWGEKTVREIVAHFRTNRDYCLERLRAMPGLTVPEPDGAFYLFPHVAGLEDSFGLCRQILHETRVGVAPGVAFGEGGEGSIRLCYAADRTVLGPALDRLATFFQSRSTPHGR
ncbi:MAG: aminotransferase class I/II-fold pyridoxal phosphate-dependent enzyme [Acidobacteria bacterium]|nr:aminotransferase class I/II-fold pyridoxal phosphate-dependent enzyme [Acidobacteriota bacterium]